MSEYMQPQSKASVEALENTLFDDTVIDALADKLGSYDQAYRSLGISAPTYERPESVVSTDGASVELGARAVAISNIMSTYNQLNKNMGARIVSEIPNSSFNQRYRYPEEITEQMGSKASNMLHANKNDFDVLNDTEGMIRAGFSAEYAESQKAGLKRGLVNKYGPGKAYAPERKKVVTKIERTVKRSQKSLSK